MPGKGAGIKSMILEAGTSVMQKFAPTRKISQHVCAFHFYAHDMTRQVGGPPLHSTPRVRARESPGALLRSSRAGARRLETQRRTTTARAPTTSSGRCGHDAHLLMACTVLHNASF